jgi:hypothetical protein
MSVTAAKAAMGTAETFGIAVLSLGGGAMFLIVTYLFGVWGLVFLSGMFSMTLILAVGTLERRATAIIELLGAKGDVK